MVGEEMRTFKEFRKQMEGAHDCELCHGKIFVIEIDKFGNQFCGYCKQKVNYPIATTEEMLRWIDEKEKNETS